MATGGPDDAPKDQSTLFLTEWGAPGSEATGSHASPGRSGDRADRARAAVDGVLAGLATRVDPEDRYEDLGRLGVGGMGEVRRVRDRLLGRTAAMKTLRSDRLEDPIALARFLEEAQATAQLQHPGIVPVHDLGRLADGSVFFVMREVQGQTLGAAIDALHRGEPLQGWGMRRLVEALARAAEAVAYAHARAVVHRDIKPANLMLGRFGEVLVVDWGLAALGQLDSPAAAEAVDQRSDGDVESVRTGLDSLLTHAGSISGTPAYMAPEQARGATDQIGPATDVYALGACLYQLLTGRAPYEGSTELILMQVLAGPPVLVPVQHDPDLVALTRVAMRPDPEGRGAADGFARALHDWLDGAQRRDHALELVGAAGAAEQVISALEAQARDVEAQADSARQGVADWAPIAQKQVAWDIEDRAASMTAQARSMRQRAERDLYGALAWDAALPEVRASLAELHRRHHAEAEARGDTVAAESALGLLADHAHALPAHHADRADHLAYVDGGGALSLVTEPAATATLYRMAEVRRQRVPVHIADLGLTPIHRHPLPMGSYLVVLSAEGHQDLRYPVWIPRQRHWDGIPPGATEPVVLRLPRVGELPAEDRLVPAGWFRSGASPDKANAPFPPAEVWLDGLVVRRHAVRLSEYLAFLDDLAQSGRIDEARQRAPHPPKAEDPTGDGVGFDGERFVLQVDRDGDLWQPDWPVIRINLADARAFAAWEALRTGQAWRLPTEVEWEKAARGVDGRLYPWGDHGDFAFSNLRRSHADGLRLLPVDHPMLDRGPYELVGMAGNVVCWTDSAYDEGVAPDVRGVLSGSSPGLNTRTSTRGGAFTWSLRAARAPDRKSLPASARSETTGIRLVRSYK